MTMTDTELGNELAQRMLEKELQLLEEESSSKVVTGAVKLTLLLDVFIEGACACGSCS